MFDLHFKIKELMKILKLIIYAYLFLKFFANYVNRYHFSTSEIHYSPHKRETLVLPSLNNWLQNFKILFQKSTFNEIKYASIYKHCRKFFFFINLLKFVCEFSKCSAIFLWTRFSYLFAGFCGTKMKHKLLILSANNIYS